MQIDEKALEAAVTALEPKCRSFTGGANPLARRLAEELSDAAILAYESAKQKGEAEGWRSISDEPLEALAHARTTAANDDMSNPGTVERERHCQRIAAMQSASEEIVKLRAMLSAGGEG